MNPKELSQFPLGDKNDAFATYFVGQSYLHMLSTQQVAIANVTFGYCRPWLLPRMGRKGQRTSPR